MIFVPIVLVVVRVGEDVLLLVFSCYLRSSPCAQSCTFPALLLALRFCIRIVLLAGPMIAGRRIRHDGEIDICETVLWRWETDAVSLGNWGEGDGIE